MTSDLLCRSGSFGWFRLFSLFGYLAPFIRGSHGPKANMGEFFTCCSRASECIPGSINGAGLFGWSSLSGSSRLFSLSGLFCRFGLFGLFRLFCLFGWSSSRDRTSDIRGETPGIGDRTSEIRGQRSVIELISDFRRLTSDFCSLTSGLFAIDQLPLTIH